MASPCLADTDIVTLLEGEANGCEPVENFLVLLIAMYPKKLLNICMDICKQLIFIHHHY